MLCNPEVFDNKIDRLNRFYDLSNPRDLFTVVMQEMEVVEAQAMYRDKNEGEIKKNHLMKLLSKIAERQEVKEINLLDVVSAYVDDMCRASKLDFAINKEQPK